MPNPTPIGNLKGIGLLGLENISSELGPFVFNRLFSIILGVLTMVASIWFLFSIITAAYSWMHSGGDKTAVENARNKIVNAMIGLIIVISAIFILDLVGQLMGFPFITSPAFFINNIIQ